MNHRGEHALVPMPGRAAVRWAREHGHGRTLREAWETLMAARDGHLDAMTGNPLVHGWEPSVWWVADAMWDCPVQSEAAREAIGCRLGWSWQDWKTAVRRKLGMAHPVRTLLINGVNRGSKSHYAAKRMMMLAQAESGVTIMALHSTYTRCIEEQQPLYWEHFPPEWKKKVLGSGRPGDEASISYKPKTGFSGMRAILPNGTDLRWRYYSQDVAATLEGTFPRYVHADEDCGLDWLQALERRTSQKSGAVLLTYTPVYGWTETVGPFLEGMRVAWSVPGYMLPRDGGPALPWRALGLEQAEYEYLQRCQERKTAPQVPQSRPQDCVAWVTEERKDGRGKTEEERVFDPVPRVGLCKEPLRGVIFFQSGDNPYGNPKEVMRRAVGQGHEMVLRSVYGMARRKWGARFPMWRDEVHVVPDAAIPREGENFLLADPATGRNWWMVLLRATKEAVYVVWEWPGGGHIPGVGVPDPWAVPSSKNPEKGNDGARGGGQENFGFGWLRMKFEEARLNGWADWREWAAATGAGADDVAPLDLLEQWEQENGAETMVEVRFIDARPAAAPVAGRNESLPLIEALREQCNWDWTPAPTQSQVEGKEGLELLADALAWQKIGERWTLRPALRVAESCRNVRWALRNYTGADGLKGACKDVIDTLRWFFEAGVWRREGDGRGPAEGAEAGRGGPRGGADEAAMKHGIGLTEQERRRERVYATARGGTEPARVRWVR